MLPSSPLSAAAILSCMISPDAPAAGSEPDRKTDPELAGILAELSKRERIFHQGVGACRHPFDRAMAESFWEIGASGRRHSRTHVLDMLEERFSAPHEDVWEATDFCCQRLATDLYLLTYTLLQDKTRLTRRSTIWRRTAEGWKIVFHQGTIVQDV